MYNVVLAAVLFSGGEATAWCHGSCYGCSGCYGSVGYPGYYRATCHGCSGCYGYSSCRGCYGSWGYSYYSSGCSGCFGCSCSGVVIAMPAYSTCHGCSGCYGCHGCWGCYGTVVAAPQVAMPVVQPVMPGAIGDPKVTPRNEAERKALEKLLRELRDKDKDKDKEIKKPTSADATTAHVTITLPADARLWVDQVECPLTSAVRSFNTPALQPGQTYFYTIRVQVERDGVPVTDSQRVLLSAGQEVTVNFSNMSAVSTAQR
jgi:uncharacterized protein (TIGR03000 family)